MCILKWNSFRKIYITENLKNIEKWKKPENIEEFTI